MFEIKYRIVENVETLLNITPEIFDKDFRDFAGQIELNFDGNKIGYVYEEEISEEMFKVGCFQDQWLLWWFTDLIKAVKLLRLNNYLAFSVPECPNWIKFIKSDNCIRVQELREIPNYTIANFKLASIPEMSTKPPVVEILLDTGETYSKDIQMEPTNFAESKND